MSHSCAHSESSIDDDPKAIEEGQKDYRPGGYHPVILGEVFHKKYKVEAKLGWGHFSTVWLVSDLTRSSKDVHKLAAMKVQKSAKHYSEAAEDEMRLLSKIHEQDKGGEQHVVAMLDSFWHRGPNGNHACLVFEVLGDNLLTWIKRYHYKGLPIEFAKMIAKDVLKGLAFLHDACGIIHTDLKPENVVFLPFVQPQYEMLSQNVDELAGSFQSLMHVKEKEDRSKSIIKNDNERYESKSALQSPSKDVGLAETNALSPDQSAVIDESKLSKSQKKRLKMKLRKAAGVVVNTPPVVSLQRPPRVERSLSLCGDVKFLPPVVFSKIVDLGNACWIDHHFTDDITTRQYRAPETLLGAPYGTSVDIFSCACLIFELVTGEYLFDPEENDNYDRDEDHLALIIELIGPPPLSLLKQGTYTKQFFSAKGALKHIKSLDPWDLASIFAEKYKHDPAEAKILASFLLPMLEWDPSKRITASQALKHPWLNM